MLTFKAEVLKSKQKSDGTYNVKIRMTYNREAYSRSRCHSKALSGDVCQTAS